MNLIPVAEELMQKVSQEELIAAVKSVMPRISVEVQADLIKSLKRKLEKSGNSRV
jgi:hypothetical protein